MEEEDNIIVKWAQEDVETSYNLLNKNKDLPQLPPSQIMYCSNLTAINRELFHYLTVPQR